MTARLQRRRIRRQPLLYGATAVLCSATVALIALSLIGYVKYQQLAANARNAAITAGDAEEFLFEMNLLTPLTTYGFTVYSM
jgi:hypothetical protein